MVILSMLSFKNIRHIRSEPRQQRHQIRSMTKKDFQRLRCLFVQDIVYVTFGLPINVYYVYAAATLNQTRTNLPLTINNFICVFVIFLHHIPYCASFVIFVIVSKAFRHELKRWICKIRGENLLAVREEENKSVERDNVQ